MENAQVFWNTRVRRLGHTGWSDPVIYAYDQLARLRAIDEVLRNLDIPRRRALDFGTGTGDFAALLSRSFEHVFAFDFSPDVLRVAKVKYGDLGNIQFREESVRAWSTIDGPLDLILTVTVLDHILDANAWRAVFHQFRDRLGPDGVLLSLEYAPDAPRPSTDYQAFRTLSVWRSTGAACGLVLQRAMGFHHPEESPAASYLRYLANLGTMRRRILSLLIRRARLRPAEGVLRRVARDVLRETPDLLDSNAHADSPLKIMIFQRSDDAGRGREGRP
jgi:SAM-dependent methyltransferase